MDANVRFVLGKTPLAEAVWLLFDNVLPDSFLGDFYETHRGLCYERAFSFAHIVHLVNDALLRNESRAQPTLVDHERSERCPATEQAFYGKLRRMPVPLSEAFLLQATSRLRPWMPKSRAGELPPSCNAFRVLVFDGKTFKKAAKRLKPVRGRAGRALGGRALVALELSTGLLVGMAADPDAHVNEAKLVPRLLPMLREHVPGTHLYVADRGFGDLAQFKRCTDEGHHCVLRLHKKSVFTPDATQPVRTGVDDRGRAWKDEIGVLSSSREGSRPARRITLERSGDEPLAIVTDLLDTDRFPANDLLELYRKRWNIESVFQKISDVFHLTHLIGSSPKAVIFQAAFCMVMYNLLQVLQAIVADTQNRKPSSISTYHLFKDLHKQLNGLFLFVTPTQLIEVFQTRAQEIEDVRGHLHALLGTAWHKRWSKRPPKKHHAKKVKHQRGQAGHFSIHRVLLENKQTKDV
jgi:hypothetical protein